MSEPTIIRRINIIAANVALDLEPTDRVKQSAVSRAVTVALCDLADSILEDERAALRDLTHAQEVEERCDRCNELASCFGPLATCESCDSAVCRRCVSDDAALCRSCVSAQGRGTEWAVKGTAAERDFLPSGF